MKFIKCKEYWYDDVLKKVATRNLAINLSEIISFFDFYDTYQKKTVLRVYTKDIEFHDIDMDFDSFCERIQNYLDGTEWK